MKGDNVVIEEQHLQIGKTILKIVLPQIVVSEDKYTIAIAGESGSGKSTTALALSNVLNQAGFQCVILQQDDYYVYPPKTNDQMRRQHPEWRGTKEVHLDRMDQNLKDFLKRTPFIKKPFIIYQEDRIDCETLNVNEIRVVIVEGTFVSLLKHAHLRVFIDRNYLETRMDREKRSRDTAELDGFTEGILENEHRIVASHKERADIIITKDYKVINNME